MSEKGQDFGQALRTNRLALLNASWRLAWALISRTSAKWSVGMCRQAQKR